MKEGRSRKNEVGDLTLPKLKRRDYMAYDLLAVHCIRNSEEERFSIVFIDPGYMRMRCSEGFLTESQLTVELEKMGVSGTETRSRIDKARNVCNTVAWSFPPAPTA